MILKLGNRSTKRSKMEKIACTIFGKILENDFTHMHSTCVLQSSDYLVYFYALSSIEPLDVILK